MAFQSVPNTFEVVLHMVCNAKPLVNTFYFETLGDYTLLDLEGASEAMWDWWVTYMADQYPVAVLLNSITARGLENQNDFEFTYSPGVVAGTIANNPTPSNVAFCVSRRSQLTGRSARGRVYIGPLAISVLTTDENFVSQVWADNLVDALNEIKTLAGILALNLEEVIVSRQTNGVLRQPAVTFNVAQYIYTDLRVDSQRGRLS